VVPAPVHLTYFTAWPDEDGKIQYFSDFYGRDKTMLQARTIVLTGRRPAADQKIVDGSTLPSTQILQ
jgi:murein L,D-transpeptidase YcbB/YkuD